MINQTFSLIHPALTPILLLDSVGQLSDLVIDRAALGHQLADFPIGVHDCCVVTAAKGLANLGKREFGEFAAEIHRNLPGAYKNPRS